MLKVGVYAPLYCTWKCTACRCSRYVLDKKVCRNFLIGQIVGMFKLDYGFYLPTYDYKVGRVAQSV